VSQAEPGSGEGIAKESVTKICRRRPVVSPDIIDYDLQTQSPVGCVEL
jgi:hypothetical protein